MFSVYRTPICFLALLLLFASSVRAKTISDSKYGFTLEIPSDFAGDPQLVTRRPNLIYAFRKPGPGPIGGTCLLIERLRETIGPRHLTAADLPVTANANFFTCKWKGLDVDCIQIVEGSGGTQIVTCKARIPLKDEAIQIWVGGTLDQAHENRALLGQIVASLEGDSNLLDPEFIAGQNAERLDRSTLIIATLLAVLASLLVYWVVQRQCPNGSLLVLAAVIYASTFGFMPGHDRELLLIQGTLRMIGFIGLIWGGIDRYRWKNRRAKPAGAQAS